MFHIVKALTLVPGRCTGSHTSAFSARLWLHISLFLSFSLIISPVFLFFIVGEHHSPTSPSQSAHNDTVIYVALPEKGTVMPNTVTTGRHLKWGSKQYHGISWPSSQLIWFGTKQAVLAAQIILFYPSWTCGWTHPKMKIYSHLCHPICRLGCLFIGIDLEKFCITSLAHHWILCREWVPSEWESKQLVKTSQ